MVGSTIRGRALQPQPQPATVARDLDAVLGAVRQAPVHAPDERVVVFSEDHALRAALRDHGVILGSRYSAELAQERRQFYTMEAKLAVAEARAEVADIEAVWQTYAPAQQRRAYLDAGQGPEPTLWEQRVAAHTRLDRRQRMIPQASLDGELPVSFVEVERGEPGTAPYAVSRWTRIWDSDLSLTRYERDGVFSVQHLAQVATLAHGWQAAIYADEPRLQVHLYQQGIPVAVEPHLAEQRPYVSRSEDRRLGAGLGA